MQPQFTIFGLSIDSYLFMTILAVIVTIATVIVHCRFKKEFHIPWYDVLFLAVFVMVGVFCGARLLFFITMIPNIHSWNDVWKYIWEEGGFVFYGGLIGGFWMAMLYVKLYGMDPSCYGEVIFSALPLGHAIGRIGCFMAGCCYGALTDASHGFHFYGLEEGVYALPVQLYEAGFLFCLFIVLTIILYIRKYKPYFITGLYFVLYGVWRFIIEFWRGDEIRGVALLSTSQWISIALIGLGLCFLLLRMERLSLFRKTTPIVLKKK